MQYKPMILAAALMTAAAPSWAGSQAKSFVIEAEYRGLVRKTFPNIGRVGLAFAPEGRDTFAIRGNGTLTNPCDASKVYEISLDMRFRMQGQNIDYVATRNSCKAGSEELRATIERLLPFVYLAQHLPEPDGKRRALTSPHGRFEMVYGGRGAQREIVLKQGSASVCKFFLHTSSDGSARLQRFRVPGKDSVQLSFLSGAPTATTD